MNRRAFLQAVVASFLVPVLPALPIPEVPPQTWRLLDNEKAAWKLGTVPRPFPPYPRHVVVALFNELGEHHFVDSGTLRSPPCPPGKRWHFDGFKVDAYGRGVWPTFEDGAGVDRNGRALAREHVDTYGLGEGERVQTRLHVPRSMTAAAVAHMLEYDEGT